MGYNVSMECSVRIKKTNEKKLKSLFVDLEKNVEQKGGGKSDGKKHYSWVGDSFSKLPVVEAFEEWRYSVSEDDGYFVVEEFTGQKLGDDNYFWSTLASVVEDGSEITCVGEDGLHWIWVFKNGKMKEKTGRIVYED